MKSQCTTCFDDDTLEISHGVWWCGVCDTTFTKGDTVVGRKKQRKGESTDAFLFRLGLLDRCGRPIVQGPKLSTLIFEGEV